MTKLTAVQRVLQDVDNGFTAALDTGGASPAAWAERAIDEIEPGIQLEGWHYNTWEEIELSPTLYTFDNAAWTAASKTLTQTGKFATASVGQTLDITDANGGTEGEYTVATVVSADAVTLEEELDAGDIASGIVGAALTNRIAVPTGTLGIDSSHASFGRNITQIGTYLHDLDEIVDSLPSNQFDDDITVSGKFRMEWGCIPLYVQEYILAAATLQYAYRFGRFKDRIPRFEREVIKRKANALREDTDNADVNILNTAHARAVRGGRSNVDAGDRAR